MNRLSFQKNKGFTLIELLFVISIIAILSTVILSSVSESRAAARDARRLADLDTLYKAIQSYQIDNNGALPGLSDDSPGAHVSDFCTSDLANDLKNGGYLEIIPTDPLAPNNCNGSSMVDDSLYFYGWDSQHAQMNNCLSVNRFETEGAIRNVAKKFKLETDTALGKLSARSVTAGSHMNIDRADLNYCFGGDT